MAAKRQTPGAKTKKCARPGCGVKPIAQFPINRALADGRGAYCRPCKRAADRGEKSPKARGKLQAPKAEILAVPPTKPGARGPPSTITPELIEELCTVLRRGHTRRAAARKCGVLEDTFASWMKRGAEDKSGAARELYYAVSEAEGEGEFALLEIVRDGAAIDPQQARWILERRYSQGTETWVRKEHIDVTTGPEMPEVSVVRELLFSRLKGLGGGSTPPVAPRDAGGGGSPAGTEPDRNPPVDGTPPPPPAGAAT